TTDSFGDFKLDNLAENSGKYAVEIRHPDHGKEDIEVEVKKSLTLGTIFL
ncbi:MAG: hypothetical protein H6Q48_4693, partial [Deltaproteobacteria bacterium]|nr:hypothetical protein [Deltaproteobacteria bacterium]